MRVVKSIYCVFMKFGGDDEERVLKTHAGVSREKVSIVFFNILKLLKNIKYKKNKKWNEKQKMKGKTENGEKNKK